MDIACSVRMIKQNAMQSFLCRLEESALSSGKWMRVDKPFRSPKNMKTYEILMLLILHSILFCITGSSVPVRHRLHDKSYVDCKIQVCRFWPIKIQFNLTVIWANDAPQVWALVADPGGSHCQVHRFQKTDVLRFYNWLTYWSWQFHLHIPFYRYWWDLNQKGLHLRTRRMNCKKKFLFGESFLTSYW